MQCVNVVDVLLPLVNLSLYPMSVEVSEKVVYVLGCSGVPIPFSDVETEESLV
jgi:hypothetical protein